MLKCFDKCNSVSVTKKWNTYSSFESRTLKGCEDTRQWRRYNCSSGTGAVNKFTGYRRKRPGTTPTLRDLRKDQRHPYHYSWTAQVSGRSSSKDIFCWMSTSTGNVFYMSGYSASTTLTSGVGIVLMLPGNAGIRSTSPSAFGMAWSGTMTWAPVFWQDDCSVTSGLSANSSTEAAWWCTSLSVRQRLCFQHDGAAGTLRETCLAVVQRQVSGEGHVTIVPLTTI